MTLKFCLEKADGVRNLQKFRLELQPKNNQLYIALVKNPTAGLRVNCMYISCILKYRELERKISIVAISNCFMNLGFRNRNTCAIQVTHIKEEEEKKGKVQLKMQLHNFNPDLHLRSSV